MSQIVTQTAVISPASGEKQSDRQGRSVWSLRVSIQLISPASGELTFSDGASIEYRVKAKLDGTGQGRYVDHFKNKMDEGEILYPPGSRFKVVNVIDPEPLGEPPTKPDLPVLTPEESYAWATYETKKMQAEMLTLDDDGNFPDIEPDDLTPLEQKMQLAKKLYEEQKKAYYAAQASYEMQVAPGKTRYIIELEEV